MYVRRDVCVGADGVLLHLRLRRVWQRQRRLQRHPHGHDLRGVRGAVGRHLQQEAVCE